MSPALLSPPNASVLAVAIILTVSASCASGQSEIHRPGISSEDVEWRWLSSENGEIPAPDVGEQVATLIFDVDGDGLNDIVIAGWGKPSMVWLRRHADGWDRYVIDEGVEYIEAGGAYADIDGDGDLDIVQGGDWRTLKEVWWWENPAPHFDPDQPWTRRLVKNTDRGGTGHHDQIFGDFDGDGRRELAFWNNFAFKLFVAEIPVGPDADDEWPLTLVHAFDSTAEGKYEGLARGDVDGDGVDDIIGGGHWFRFDGDGRYSAHPIDASYYTSRSAVGDLIPGGRPEIVLSSGDRVNSLNWYEWDLKIDGPSERWYGPFSEGSAVADVNNDGILDIVAGPNWYEGPSFIKHPLREVRTQGEFVSNSGDHPVDVNGDGWVDIISNGWFDDQNIYWYENPGVTGVLWKEHKIADATNTELLVLEDIDGDGDLDILPSMWGEHTVFWVEIEGTRFTKHEVGPHLVGHGIGLGDIDGDGRKDIITTNGWYQAPEDRTEPWTWHPEFETRDHAGIPMLVYDVNGDGRADVIYGMGHDFGLFWLEQPARRGEEWIHHVIDTTYSQVHALKLADVNSDGRLDLVTGKRLRGHRGRDSGAHEPLVLYWYDIDTETAEFTRHVIAYNGMIGTGMQINFVDVDSDGDEDIVVSGKSGLFLLENMSRFEKDADDRIWR